MLYYEEHLSEVSEEELRELRKLAQGRKGTARSNMRRWTLVLAQAEMDEDACKREVFRRLKAHERALTQGERHSLASVTPRKP